MGASRKVSVNGRMDVPYFVENDVYAFLNALMDEGYGF